LIDELLIKRWRQRCNSWPNSGFATNAENGFVNFGKGLARAGTVCTKKIRSITSTWMISAT